MKVDYFFEEIKGMDIEDAVAYLRELLTLGSDEDIYPTEDEEVYRLLLASPQYLERARKDELHHDFLILEGIDPDLPYEYQTPDYTDWEEWDSPCFRITDYDRALQEVETQEDKYLEDCLKVMAAESHDREAAEIYLKFGTIPPINDWNTFTKYVSMWRTTYIDFYNQWSFNHPSIEEDEEDSDEKGVDIDDLNDDLDILLKDIEEVDTSHLWRVEESRGLTIEEKESILSVCVDTLPSIGAVLVFTLKSGGMTHIPFYKGEVFEFRDFDDLYITHLVRGEEVQYVLWYKPMPSGILVEA